MSAIGMRTGLASQLRLRVLDGPDSSPVQRATAAAGADEMPDPLTGFQEQLSLKWDAAKPSEN